MVVVLAAVSVEPDCFLKASLLLEEGSTNFEVVPIQNSDEPDRSSVLVFNKVTETGSPFIVVAGYCLRQTKTYQGSVLAEIETVRESEYAKLKQLVREKLGEKLNKIPITFW